MTARSPLLAALVVLCACGGGGPSSAAEWGASWKSGQGFIPS